MKVIILDGVAGTSFYRVTQNTADDEVKFVRAGESIDISVG